MNPTEHRPLRIGIDIDDVLAETCPAVISSINTAFGTALHYEEMTRFYNFSGLVPQEQLTDIYLHLDGTYKEDSFQYSFPPVVGAKEVITEWNDKGHRLYFITARPNHVREITKRWLTDYGFYRETSELYLHDQAEYPSGAEYKTAIVRILDLDFMIEDSLEYIDAMTLPVLLFDRPWNQHELPRHATRVKSWKEIRNHVAQVF